jgi:hypothetical protein
LKGLTVTDTQSFLIAVAAIMCVAMSATRIVDFVVGPKVQACTITFSDSTGNRHQFIGKGEVW